jgi:hypothetical protein
VQAKALLNIANAKRREMENYGHIGILWNKALKKSLCKTSNDRISSKLHIF